MNAIHPVSARKKLVVQPEKLYTETITAIEDENWEKLKNAIHLGTPLYKEIEVILKNHYISKIDLAISQSDSKQALKYFMELVIGGIKVLLNTTIHGSINSRKDAVRQGFKEYLTLAAIFTEADRDSASLTVQVFRNALQLSANAPKYKTTIQHLNFALADLVSKV